MHILYGDGIHDDTLAIQELIDSGKCEVSLPAPEKCYLISKPLELPSNFRLVLPRFAEIKLKDGSNCTMLQNKLVKDFKERPNGGCLWYYLNEYSPDFTIENVEVVGGIWNYNNKGQAPNPQAKNVYDIRFFGGYPFLFYNVRNLKISSLTIKDPINFAITMDKIEYFTVSDITFDFNDGNPDPGNMDGVHLCGNCRFGLIENIKGSTYDDLVALNADEGSQGEVSNIEVRGLYAENCHSAIRLLSANYPIKNIHISDVFGTYYQYSIGLTRYYHTDDKGIYENVSIENVFASKAKRYCVRFRVMENKDGSFDWADGEVWRVYGPEKFGGERYEEDGFAVIWIDSLERIKGLKIANLYRTEYNTPIETIRIKEDTEIEALILDNVIVENHTGKEMPFMVNNGEIKSLITRGIFQDGKEIKL